MTSFTRAIHTKEWWNQDMAEANALLAPYANLQPEELTPEIAIQLFSVLIREVGRVALITRALALEKPAPRRGRPPKAAQSRPVRQSSNERSVTINQQAALIEFKGLTLTPDQARALAEQLSFAADEVEGITPFSDDAQLPLATPDDADPASQTANG